ncbi:serine hydrolase domain-containing protein [Granulicella cerasi]|uniref:Serine hydrolase domain-containing protein n=1 Tax=Granulicella cerasi TaxID=741063 RepID=A0ABW1ZDL7_9BACT|nr:serine hydrolase domain-containing protein [Granulicella cerasi]
MTAVLQPFLDKGILTGAVILTADQERILDLEAFGSRDVAQHQAMTTSDEFWIASMTKAFTAAAVTMLVDDGKLSLNDPVEKYLPEFRGQQVLVGGKLVPAIHPILLREVLSSTSCLPFSSSWERAHGKLDQRPLKVAVAEFAFEPLRCQPGTSFLYSNEGFSTAARVLEVITGKPYELFLQQRIFDPLGMTDTTFWPSGKQLARLATTYRADQASRTNDPATNDQLTPPFSDHSKRYPMPAGGLFSTATDVAHFCQMLLGHGVYQGRRLLSDSAVATMFANQAAPTATDGSGNPARYGLGLYIRSDGVGHPGAYKTEMRLDTQHDLITVFMVQQQGPWLSKDGDRMVGLLHDTWLKLSTTTSTLGTKGNTP